MEINKYILLGGGEHSRVIADVLLDSQATIHGYFDPVQRTLYNLKWLGAYNGNLFPDSLAVVSIGNNRSRMEVTQNVQHSFGTVIHTSALISKFARHGVGCMILHGSVIQTGSRLESHVIVNTKAQIDHDCVIGSYAHIAPGAILCGTVEIGEGAFIGAGAIILPGRKVGAWSVVGAGTVVTKNIGEGDTVVGNPAKKVN
jgi:sugar O-acyltransferase (sialic acid O-acetyltransferase NeuD family)